MLFDKTLSQTVFVAFDTETTGLSPMDCRVVEFGCVRFTLDNDQESYSQLIRIDRPMPPDASRINGITDAMLKDQPDFKAVAETIRQKLTADVLIAHNALFDIGFLNAEFARAGITAPASPVIDSIAVAKTALPGLPSYRLGALCSTLKIQNPEAHRALADSMTLAKLFRHFVKELKQADTPLSRFLSPGKTQGLGGSSLGGQTQPFIRTLQHAIDHLQPVTLEYESTSGKQETFSVVPFAVERLAKSSKLHARNEKLKQNQEFLLEKIKSVRSAAAPPPAQGMLF